MMVKAAISRTGVPMPVHRSFERELAQLEALSGHAPDADGIERVRRALASENNYLVAKAAGIAADHAVKALLPEVLSAFDRFFVDPVKNDPQCWAKNALAKALVRLECRDATVYLRGLRHTQEEPVWGGHSDTAGALRGTCTHALVACGELTDTALLNILLEPLLDQDKTVRIEAARFFFELHLGQPVGAYAIGLARCNLALHPQESALAPHPRTDLLRELPAIEAQDRRQQIRRHHRVFHAFGIHQHRFCGKAFRQRLTGAVENRPALRLDRHHSLLLRLRLPQQFVMLENLQPDQPQENHHYPCNQGA